MLNDIDKKFKLDIQITFIATFISVLFIVSALIWKDKASDILSVLVVILPTIYIIGNLIIRGIMDREFKDMRNTYEEGLLEVDEGIEEMSLQIEKLEKENKRLKEQNKKVKKSP